MASVNYDTILSNFEGKLTLMQWLKACDASLKTLTEDFSDMSEDLDDLGTRLSSAEVTIGVHTTNIQDLSSRILNPQSGLEVRVNDLDTRVTALENAPAGGTSLYLHQMTCQSPAFTLEIITASSDQIQTGLQLSNNAYPKFVGVRRFTINGVGVAFVNWQLNPITSSSVLQGLAVGATALTTTEVSLASVITDSVTAL